jgi:phospholipid/cholesterol/gamma-HCH transport system substrate-binding protein
VRSGGSLGLSQNQDYTEVDQILNTLAGATEGRAREVFQGVGAGVNGEGQNLNNTLGGFASLVNNSPPLTSTLGVQHQQVADIIQNLGNIMGAIGQRGQAIQALARGALTTFNDVANRDADFKRMLVAFPYALHATRDALHQIGTDGPTITPVINDLAGAAIKLEPSFSLLQPASSRGIELLDALGSASPALKSVLVSLERTKPSAVKALPAVHALTCQVDPMARFIQPYGNDIASFFENYGAAVEPYETNAAHELLGSLTVDPTNLFRGLTAQPNVTKLLTTLFDFGVFAKTGGSFGYRALLPPGHIGDLAYGKGVYGPAGWGAAHTYPHVTQDCAK